MFIVLRKELFLEKKFGKEKIFYKNMCRELDQKPSSGNSSNPLQNRKCIFFIKSMIETWFLRVH
ncbi:hypothetical protein C6Y45_13175 [Alkalicoccus saliphilus]|uniref:Uncharacterized protein n=1 Tax=Alkalicoccus saliphilus TaxID=200989 RepID=A0A2T4U3T0_9BACI|nr:hypothetical protein C6Y45_13175 [Alkalicoccus saliphilus]